ncbi:Major Facilitator Superfamily protein [Pseudonocardia thermophila]|uniref:Major Facilitator Superfamily protein n=1 Tax=Pseudonocardia thermophila TaxID=1848 RepID=A0A1M6NIW1_PSETH|nr:MFS transporter [Pseudonocardia thermophila]SHJ95576.1 Major Facilitator Superfamily protein [Pseudonocardia thermophila]
MSSERDAPARDPQQRRILTVLVAAQVLSGAGLAAGITVGALLAQEMLGGTALAGLPTALFTVGSAVAAAAVGRISDTGGRRRGLTVGYTVGAVGALGVVLAAVLGSPALLFAAFVLYGSGTATNLQARYAGADAAAPQRRASAVSTVLLATTLGGVLGPNLTAISGAAVAPWGVPALAGPFLLAALAYGAAAVVLGLMLRPDPLLLARERAAAATVSVVAATVDGPAVAAPEPAQARSAAPSVVVGAVVMTVTQLVMVAIMTMTPVHLTAHGHGVGIAGMVIAVHVAAMFLPSPITGRLVDRFGPLRMAAASGGTLLFAGLLAAIAPADSVPLLTIALALLGLGWNIGLVSGTAILAAVPLDVRARTQGKVDVAIALSGAGAGLASGLVVSAAGYSTLALAGGVAALVIVPAVAAAPLRRRRAARAATDQPAV